MSETLWAAIIGAVVTGIGLIGPAIWVLGGLRRDVQRNNHKLDNGLTALVQKQGEVMASMSERQAAMLEHQKGQDEVLRRLVEKTDRIESRFQVLPCQHQPGQRSDR